MEKIFLPIYQFFAKRRAVFMAVFIFSFLLTAWFASRVKLEEDLSKILPEDKKIGKLNEIFQNSRFMDKLVIMVSMKDTSVAAPDSLVAFAEYFAGQVGEKLTPYVSKLNDKINDSLAFELFSTISDRLPVYLTEEDYKSIDTLIAPAKIKETLEQNYRTLVSPAGLVLKNMISKDPVGISFIGFKKLQQLQYDENFELYESYVVTKDHKNLLMFITPAYPPNNTGKNALLLEGLDSIISSSPFTGTEAVYFGATAVSAGNALQLRKDALFTQGITLTFLVIFLGFYFRKKRAPFIILIPVLFGALFSLAFIYFIKGSISVIAIGTGSVVLGIAVNYSLHVFNHYRHRRNMQEVIKDLSKPLTIGGFTTVGGFLCLQFVKSEMLKDLGLFAGLSLIGASLCSLIFLPHLIGAPRKDLPSEPSRLSWIDRIAAYRPEYNKWSVLLILLLTVVFAFTAGNVRFESDMMRMNYMPDKLKQAEDRLNKINEYALQSVYLVTEGNTLDEALASNEKLTASVESLKEKKIIRKYAGVSSLIISDSLQKERIRRWNTYWTSAKKQQLLATLEKEGKAAGFSMAAFDNFRNLLNKAYQPAPPEAMVNISKNFLEDFITVKPGKSMVITLVKAPRENNPVIYKAFEDDRTVTVLDKQYLTARLVEIVNADFTSIALMSSILVFAVLLITYGRIELTLVSFIPMLLTWIWILGIMSILGIQFNIINIIVSTLIFGLGDDYSLFIMDGLLNEYKTGRKNLSSYKSSIFLSAITTITGLGVLVFAKHPALRSIALISIIGIFCVVLMSQVLIPFFFRLLIKNRTDAKKFPWTAAGLFKSVFAFSYFFLGSILLTILGLLLVKLNPFNKEKGKLAYHAVLSGFCWSMMYIMGNVKKRIIGHRPENFSTPAVVIANHQSFLDILCMIMLHPKLILFTNNWVWNSPVFGAVVRMADYYPVAQGAENSIALVAERGSAGLFRSDIPGRHPFPNGNMKRFHKGAFFLAEKLQLDILPVVVHGTGYTMSKSDFLLKDGTVTLQYLPRIPHGDLQWGSNYSERTKRSAGILKNNMLC